MATPTHHAASGLNDRAIKTVWTVENVRQLGLSTTVDVASSILGISRTTGYALAKTGQFPVRLIRVGRRYLVPTAALINLLVADQSADTTPGEDSVIGI